LKAENVRREKVRIRGSVLPRAFLNRRWRAKRALLDAVLCVGGRRRRPFPLGESMCCWCAWADAVGFRWVGWADVGFRRAGTATWEAPGERCGPDFADGRKARHWHIDSLTRVGKEVGAWVMERERVAECAVADELGRRGKVVAGFGDSDCRCGGHLVRFATKREADSAVSVACCRSQGAGLSERSGPIWWSCTGERAKNFGKNG